MNMGARDEASWCTARYVLHRILAAAEDKGKRPAGSIIRYVMRHRSGQMANQDTGLTT